jgi:hypothetical protein
MKSQNFVLLFITFLMGSFLAKAQDIAPFQANDLAAVPITPDILQRITAKPWYLHNRSYVNKGTSDDFSHYGYSYEAFQFLPGGSCQQPKLRSTWSLNRQKNLLVITSDFPEQARQSQHLLFGGYAVYRITEEELILGKVLTSTHDTKILYCFENAERREQRRIARIAERKQNYELRKNTQDTGWAWDEKQEKLVQRIEKNNRRTLTSDELTVLKKEDLFMRNIKPEPGYVYYLDTEGNVIKIK